MRWAALGLLLLCSFGCDPDLPVDPPSTLHVLSYNIRWDAPGDGADRWRHRGPAMAGYLRRQGADLAGLQELTPAQRDDLGAAHRGLLAWDARSQVAAQVAERLSVRSTSSVDLPGGDYARGVSIVELELDGRPLTFASAHLSGGPEGLDQVQALLTALEGRPRPWVLTGDFNAYLGHVCPGLSQDYAVLCNGVAARLRAAGFRDPLLELLGDAPRSTATGFQPPEARWQPGFDARIDWVLTTPELEAVDAWIGDPTTPAGRPLSDHRPVHVVLRFAEVLPDATRGERVGPQGEGR